MSSPESDIESQPSTSRVISWRERLVFALIPVIPGVCMLGVGILVDLWVRWVALSLGVVLTSMGLDVLLLGFPTSRLRSAARILVAGPGEILIIVGGALAPVILGLTLLFYLVYMLAVVTYLLVPGARALTPAYPYFILLVTLTIASYSGDRVLIPIKWMHRFSSGKRDKVVAEQLRHASLVIRAINFRRLTYQIAILAFLASQASEFAGVTVAAWRPFSKAAFAALVGFLAIDQYISIFHPGLLAPRNAIRYGSESD